MSNVTWNVTQLSEAVHSTGLPEVSVGVDPAVLPPRHSADNRPETVHLLHLVTETLEVVQGRLKNKPIRLSQLDLSISIENKQFT